MIDYMHRRPHTFKHTLQLNVNFDLILMGGFAFYVQPRGVQQSGDSMYFLQFYVLSETAQWGLI